MKNLKQCELKEIDGGSFAMDLGWFVGHVLNGNFGSASGIAKACLNYRILYAKQ